MDTSSRDDRELVSAHLQGDRSAFDQLYRRHVDRTFALCLRTTSDREMALDVTQEIWLRLVDRLDRYRGDAAFTTWLHRVTVNRCLDELRKRRPDPVEDVPEVPVEDSDVAERLHVREALARLSTEHATVLSLVDMLGHSYEEAAEILDIAVGTVKSRLARGRLALAKELHDSGEQSDASNASEGGDP